MSRRNLYLVPGKEFPVGGFKSIALEVLKQHNIIDGFYSEKNGWLASGKQAGKLFTNVNSGFEYVEIRDSHYLRLIPQGVNPYMHVLCGSCGAIVGETLYEAIIDFYEEEGEKEQISDMSPIAIRCNSCDELQHIIDLKLPDNIILRKQYIQFVEIDSDLDNSMVSMLEGHLECMLTAFYE